MDDRIRAMMLFGNRPTGRVKGEGGINNKDGGDARDINVCERPNEMVFYRGAKGICDVVVGWGNYWAIYDQVSELPAIVVKLEGSNDSISEPVAAG